LTFNDLSVLTIGWKDFLNTKFRNLIVPYTMLSAELLYYFLSKQKQVLTKIIESYYLNDATFNTY